MKTNLAFILMAIIMLFGFKRKRAKIEIFHKFFQKIFKTKHVADLE
jgi:hypothetical protein